ncbi:MAG: Gldg family protein [Clostridia bacterium]|nr:Gldg family protein [Clostridia bacterium]
MKILKNKERKQIFLSALLLVIIIALYVEFNIIISKINIPESDITEDKVYTISEESKEKITNLEKNLKISLVDFEKYDDFVYAEDILYIIKQYEKLSDKIEVEQYEDELTEETNNQYPYIIFSTEDKARKVYLNELYSYKYNISYGNQEESYLIEPMITNSILSVTEGFDGGVYICLDKSIYSEKMYTTFVNIVGVLGYDTYGLNLSTDKNIPDNCKCLVIPPLVQRNEEGEIRVSDFSDEEKEIIVNYINNGGNILFLQESKSVVQGDTPNLDYIMSLYGVSISDGIVCQADNKIQNIPSYIYPTINTNNSIFKNINDKSKVCIFDSGKIDIVSEEEANKLNVSYNVLIQSRDNSYLRKDLSNTSLDKTEDDENIDGAVLAVYAEKNIDEKKSKAIVFSNSIIATNSSIFLKDVIGNRKLAVNAILLDDNIDLISDSIKSLINSENTVFYTKTKYNIMPSANLLTDGITLKIIFVIPMLIILIGYIVWKHRKNKM